MPDFIKKIQEDLTLENVLAIAIKAPGVKINRDTFLRKELIKYYPEEIIRTAIDFNPAKAGIDRKTINRISQSVIDYETTKVTALSFAASLPSSAAFGVAAGAATADITSYFVHILRVVQELAYLYGFEQFDFSEDNVDSETMRFLILFIGVMSGVQGASTVLQKIANALAAHIAKDLARKSLTKGVIFPIIKQIAKSIGVRMTKQIFADTVASGIPVVGGALSGAMTFVMFRPCCMRLRQDLMGYNLSNPNYYITND